MRVGSLFSGAGLLDAGLHQAGHEHAWFVERDEWRRGHLATRWPGRPVHDDVRTVGAHNLEPVDCIAGGFPCKGASTAGKRTGLAHPETALWAEFARIVGELEPRWVVVENVANILTLHGGDVWRTVVGDLAALGFDVAWDCVPAAAFGAPHGRDRVVAVASHAERGGQGQGERQLRPGQPDAAGRAADAPDAAGAGGPAGWWREREGCWELGERRRDHVVAGAQAAADADRERCGQFNGTAKPSRTQLIGAPISGGVSVEWGDYEPAIRRWEAVHGPAPEPLVRRLDDGDAKLQRVRSRVDRQRLSALGDGVHVYLGRLIGDALMELANEEARHAA